MTKPGCDYIRGRRFAVFVLVVALLAGTAVGTVGAQEEVSNAQELQDISNDLDGDYVVTDDIDLSGVNNFDPIGDFSDPFTGTFDGDGHNITGLTIDRDDELDVGLFGGVGPEGTVNNVSVEDADISGAQWVGALVGTNEGEVRDSYATGDVVAANRTGGLVGTNTPSGTVTESYARGNVTAEFIAGGLAGTNEGKVSRSYANVSVSGLVEIPAVDMGGLVGVNAGDVTDSYARGEVLGDVAAGGLVGASNGDITGSYATAEVVADTDTGGLVGDLNFDNGGATLRGSYWDEQATAQSDAAGAESGSPTVINVDGLQTNQMRGEAAENNMDAFDFKTTWATVADPDDYPVLAWQVSDGVTPPENFGVTIDTTNSPVTEGETLIVEVTVENTGGKEGTQTVSLTVGGTERDSVDVTLSEGNSKTRSLEWPTGDRDNGTYTATVESDNDTDSTGVLVEQGGDAGGSLSPDNPFGDANNEPLGISDAADVLFEWNQNNGTVDGVNISLSDMADFLFGWNQARA